ncbi:hypothetical protein DFH09DRAFT_821579, partial [Mycena vulgaris]
RATSSPVVPIAALFCGRVMDMPEWEMPETLLSFGGSGVFVGHKVCYKVGEDNSFVELLFIHPTVGSGTTNMHHISRLNFNKELGFPSLTVYGLLTDLKAIHVFRVRTSVSNFSFGNGLRVCSGIVVAADTGIFHPVNNKMFSIILKGFVDSFRANCLKGQERAAV